MLRQLGTYRKVGYRTQTPLLNNQGSGLKKLLEEQPQKKKKWTVTENKEVLMCYFEADPSQRGYRKRMRNIWLSKHPDSTIAEERLADQINAVKRRNLLTSVAIEEIQRGLSTQTCHTESSIPEQPKSNQPDLTSIEEIPQQQHNLNPRQMALKSRLKAQLQQEHRLRLPALNNTHRNKDLTQIIADINKKVLCTIDTATIEETNQLLYSTAVVVTEELGYKVQSKRTSTQNTRHPTKMES